MTLYLTKMASKFITIHKGDWQTILALQSGFDGQKIHHPFKSTRQQEKVYIKTKKRTITKTIDQMIYLPEFISEEVEQFILDENTVFQVKHDGSCGKIIYNPDTDSHEAYTRYDVKVDDRTGLWKEPNPEWIPCEEKPELIEGVSHKNMHWPHFRACEEDFTNYKYRLIAFSRLNKSILPKESFTCEYMGTKLGSPREVDIITDDCVIVPHGSATVTVPKEYRTLHGFGEIFEMFPYIEGLIVSNPNSKLRMKIRRDLIVMPDGQRLHWPPSFKDHSIEPIHISSLCAL